MSSTFPFDFVLFLFCWFEFVSLFFLLVALFFCDPVLFPFSFLFVRSATVGVVPSSACRSLLRVVFCRSFNSYCCMLDCDGSAFR